jgi:hypothetical protein
VETKLPREQGEDLCGRPLVDEAGHLVVRRFGSGRQAHRGLLAERNQQLLERLVLDRDGDL